MADHQGFILWFTGLSGSGKSTLSERVARELRGRGYACEVLDGDEVRAFLSRGLGFSRQDRDTNVLRIGYVARLLARNGVIATTAAISPYAETRAEVRDEAARNGVPFVEVYTDCAIEVLAERDVKGLYKRALAGELEHFTGVSDPYEAPESPEIHIHSDKKTVEESAVQILSYLVERKLIA